MNKTTTILSVAELIEVLKTLPQNAVPFIMDYGKDHAHAISKEDMFLGDTCPYCPDDSFKEIYKLGKTDEDENLHFDFKFLMIGGI